MSSSDGTKLAKNCKFDNVRSGEGILELFSAVGSSYWEGIRGRYLLN
jgi:hypothetical protein